MEIGWLNLVKCALIVLTLTLKGSDQTHCIARLPNVSVRCI